MLKPSGSQIFVLLNRICIYCPNIWQLTFSVGTISKRPKILDIFRTTQNRHPAFSESTPNVWPRTKALKSNTGGFFLMEMGPIASGLGLPKQPRQRLAIQEICSGLILQLTILYGPIMM